MIVNIEVDLSIEEIKFLRNFFDYNQIPNTILFKMSKKEEHFKELEEKGIIQIDNLANCKLTKVGRDILQQISRNDIIDKLI